MPNAAVVAPLLLFGLLVVLLAILARRVQLLAGDFRRDQLVRGQIADVVRRADTSLSELAAVVDDVRRRKAFAEAARPSLSASSEALRQYALEAASVPAAGGQADVREALVEDLGRAGRAVELIEHGCQQLGDGPLDRRGEGETAVKRGYLNLLHAREAIRARPAEIARAQGEPKPARPSRWRRSH